MQGRPAGPVKRTHRDAEGPNGSALGDGTGRSSLARGNDGLKIYAVKPKVK